MSVRMIGLAGPSGSGKSTIARQAQQLWPGLVIIKLDKFYKDADKFPRAGRWRNWELPEDILWDELHCVLTGLKAGREVEVPMYSKPEGRRVGMRVAEPVDLILVEGFLLFQRQRIRDLFELKIYLRVSPEVQLQRRRQREPEFDPRYFEHVMKPAFARYGAGIDRFADIVIDADQDVAAVWHEFQRALDVAE